MRVGYLECFAGVSGDMMMGALVDAGVPIEPLSEAVAALGLGAELRIEKVSRSGIQSTKIDVLADGRLVEPAASTGPHVPGSHTHSHEHRHDVERDHGQQHAHLPPAHSAEHPQGHVHPHGTHDHPGHSHGRTFSEIRTILTRTPLSARATELSIAAFESLAGAESRIHGVPIEKVHFHEVGAVDAIVDIVCCAVAIDTLALQRWYCSAINVGGGFVDCAHGRFPVPAPATAELLKAMPTYSAGPQMELVTPTGAALLRALNCQFEAIPILRADRIGYGAGTRNPERFPNVLRFTIGEIAQTQQFDEEKVTVIECAIDDLNPQVIAYTAQAVLDRGALDVMTSHVTMKKGRPGTLLTVLCRAADAGDLQELIFRETTTLGMRTREESRVFLARELVPVETEFGVIRVKVGSWRGEEWNAAPEFEDCRRAAELFHVPLKTVMQAALVQWRCGLGAASTDSEIGAGR
jgi:pyridinium-3,5-bisthiocarboxylic acid mononucleotide nickel chelatase